MKPLRSLAVVAACGAGLFVSVHLPNPLPALDHGLRRASETAQAFLFRVLTPTRAPAEPIDRKAAAKLDEDLDWRIAATAKTEKGWRQFLAAHPNGDHAPLAQAELDKIAPQPPQTSQPPKPPPPEPAPAPKPAPPAAAMLSPVMQVLNAPEAAERDYFAILGHAPPQPETRIETIVRWRDAPTRYVRVARSERRRHYRPRPPPWPFFAWFGPRAPGYRSGP